MDKTPFKYYQLLVNTANKLTQALRKSVLEADTLTELELNTIAYTLAYQSLDMCSFFDREIATINDSIVSALSGDSEALLPYGVTPPVKSNTLTGKPALFRRYYYILEEVPQAVKGDFLRALPLSARNQQMLAQTGTKK